MIKRATTQRGPGGSVGPGVCTQHGVPLTHTITDHALCAVCEAHRADTAERDLDKLRQDVRNLIQMIDQELKEASGE